MENIWYPKIPYGSVVQHEPGVFHRTVTGHPRQVLLFSFKAFNHGALVAQPGLANGGNIHGKSNAVWLPRRETESPKVNRRLQKGTGTFYNTSRVPLKSHRLRQNHHGLQCSPKALQSLNGS